nr:methyltransferase C-terminal domain-containing protein [uncultured Rhodopila sp.]
MLTMLAPAPHRHCAPEPDCGLCGAPLHRSLLDLGTVPLTHRSLAAAEPDTRHPLHIRLCDHCGLAQTGASPGGAAADHAFAEPAGRPGRYAETLRSRFHLNADSLVVDIGAAESPLLPHVQAAGIPVHPIEAATFNTATAMQIAVQQGCADIVLAHGVLPLAADMFEFAAALACILRPNGVVSLQFPHLLSLIQRVQFDAFRPDIRAHLSLPVTERLLRSVGLRVFDAERIPDDGGSLRLHVCHLHSRRDARPGVKAVRLTEADQPALAAGFAARVALARDDIRGFLRARRDAGRRVTAYGATARAAMLLNLCGVTPDEIATVADTDTTQHGRRMPGSRLPIGAPESVTADPPDDLIILPGPHVSDILRHFPTLRQTGTQIWTLLPRIARV